MNGNTSAPLWRLLRAIATGNVAMVSEMLAADPDLATEASTVGATRAASAPYFFEELGQYVYEGDTALHVAAAANRTDVAQGLVRLGASVSARNRRGAQPLHYAVTGHPGSEAWDPDAQAATVAFLLQSGADANAADRSGVTPLHRAVRTRSAPAVRLLLAHGADPGRTNTNGSTPMQLATRNTGRSGSGSDAAKAQQQEILQLLTTRGA